MESTQTQPEPKKNRLLLILMVLFMATTGTFAWLYWQQGKELDITIEENTQVLAESEVVKRDLNQLKQEYDALETNNAEMQWEINEKKALIEQLQKEAERHKNDAYIIAKLKKETKSLRDIMKHFVSEIDSLNTANKMLTAQKDSVTTELHTEKENRTQLQKEKDHLEKVGSRLKASGLKVVAMNVKGGSKETETTKAKRTDRIKISFTLGENQIAKSGKRAVYARIVMPDGKEMCESADPEHSFSFNNSKGYFAVKKIIEYHNEDTDVVLTISRKETEELKAGKYMVEVTTDEVTVGSGVLVLD